MGELLNIRHYSGRELIDKLNNNEFSVLRGLDALDLRNEMRDAGRLCKRLANIVCATRDDSKLRQRAANIIKPFSPVKVTGEFPSCEDAVVIGFNHPSLGEIFRLIGVCFMIYEDKEFLFPVNIPWYENLVPIIPQLKRMGITIVPMITPSTEAKLVARHSEDEEMLTIIKNIKVAFERNYMRAAKDVASRKGVIVVAPSATRQTEVISEHIHPTMTLLAHILLKGENARAMFLPVVILEPAINDRKFNAFKYYGIRPCKPFYTEEIKSLTHKSRDFDYIFLKRIDDVYRKFKAMREKMN